MRNVAQVGRRELHAHRQIVFGVTASEPRYQVIDSEGNKEWVIDVYIGPLEHIEQNVVFDVPIASYARHLVGDVKQPVSLERSKQGKYTVIGRAKTMPAGAQFEEGDVDTPTFQFVQHNFADLGLLWLPDLDWTLEELQVDEDTPLQADEDEPLQQIRAFDAFGLQVVGPEAVAPGDYPDGSLPPAPSGSTSPSAEKGALYSPDPIKSTTTKHLKIIPSKLGPKGDPEAMDWGVSVLSFWITKTETA